MFSRLVDIGGGSPSFLVVRAGDCPILERATEGAIAYKRDPKWTHFTFRLPLESPDQGSKRPDEPERRRELTYAAPRLLGAALVASVLLVALAPAALADSETHFLGPDGLPNSDPYRNA